MARRGHKRAAARADAARMRSDGGNKGEKHTIFYAKVGISFTISKPFAKLLTL